MVKTRKINWKIALERDFSLVLLFALATTGVRWRQATRKEKSVDATRNSHWGRSTRLWSRGRPVSAVWRRRRATQRAADRRRRRAPVGAASACATTHWPRCACCRTTPSSPSSGSACSCSSESLTRATTTFRREGSAPDSFPGMLKIILNTSLKDSNSFGLKVVSN